MRDVTRTAAELSISKFHRKLFSIPQVEEGMVRPPSNPKMNLAVPFSSYFRALSTFVPPIFLLWSESLSSPSLGGGRTLSRIETRDRGSLSLQWTDLFYCSSHLHPLTPHFLGDWRKSRVRQKNLSCRRTTLLFSWCN